MSDHPTNTPLPVQGEAMPTAQVVSPTLGVIRRTTARLGQLASAITLIGVLMTGAVMGAGAALLVWNSGRIVWDWTASVGVAAGIAAFAVFLLIRAVLVGWISRDLVGRDLSAAASSHTIWPALTRAAASALGESLSKYDREAPNALAQLAASMPELARSGASALLAFWSSSAALALGVTIAGAVVSMATVVATWQQVERMGQQNQLIERQIFEATATRVSSVFAAQLPALLDQIEKSRPKDSQTEWKPEPELVARIQSLIYATQPYSVDEEVDGWLAAVRRRREGTAASDAMRIVYVPSDQPRKYSPERGQLLLLLIAARFPFRSLPTPLDFSNSDLRNLRLGELRVVVGPAPQVDLGETILRGSNLRGAELAGVVVSAADLRETIFSNEAQLKSATFYSLPSSHRSDARVYRWLAGSNLANALVETGPTIGGGFERTASAAGYLGRFENAAGEFDLDELWSKEPFDGFSLFGSSGKHQGTANLIAAFMRDVGSAFGASLPSGPGICREEFLARLKETREALRSVDWETFQYAKVVLTDLDESSATCVFDGVTPPQRPSEGSEANP